MSDKDGVIELFAGLPDYVPINEIAREVELLAGIERARAQVRHGEETTSEEIRAQLKEWVRR